MKALIKNRRFHILLFEGLGSFILIYGICSAGMHVAPDIVVAASLFLAISLCGEVTGGYINPIITLGASIEKRHNKLTQYLLAQFVGALLGSLWSWALLGEISPAYNEGWDSIQAAKFVLNQLCGSITLAMCVLTLTNKYTSYAVKSWQVYISISVALFLTRKLFGQTMINPAAGIAIQLVAAIAKQDVLIFVRDIWPLVIPSLIGAIVGGYLTSRFYQPLLLFIKYKDLVEGDEQGEIQEQEIKDDI